MNEWRGLETVGRSTTRRQMIAGTSALLGGLAITRGNAWAAAGNDGISHSAESIHQEPVFKVSAKRIYEALTNAEQFHKVTMLSEAMKSGMPPGAKSTEISPDTGGAFTLFGGYVTGRHIELVPSQRVVQAWRTADWDPGVFSIARFQLNQQGTSTKILFDHVGFPVGKAQHLASGWQSNYWEPLKQFLSQA